MVTQCAGSPGVQPGVESADGAAVLRGGCAAVPGYGAAPHGQLLTRDVPAAVLAVSPARLS